EQDPTPDDNNAFVTELAERPQDELKLWIQPPSADPVLAGQSYSYQVTIFNAGPQDASNVHLVGQMADGSTLDLSAQVGASSTPGVLPAGSQQTITITRTAPGPIGNVPEALTDDFTVSPFEHD